MADDRVEHVKGVLRPCCADQRNLTVERREADRIVRVCKCGRRHYEFGVEPGHIGIKVS